MCSPVILIRTTVLAVGLSHLGLPTLAATCEELRASIESRIAGKGAGNFTVTVVDAAASAAGQVVGTCERGSKNLLYRRVPARAPSAPALTPGTRPPAQKGPVITECADGRVITEGSCKR